MVRHMHDERHFDFLIWEYEICKWHNHDLALSQTLNIHHNF